MVETVLQSKIQNRKSKILTSVVRDLSWLSLALWLGAAVFFSFAVAPVLFSVLPTRELAGVVVGRLLPILNISGFVIGLALFVSRLLMTKKGAVNRLMWWAEIVSLGLVAAATAVNQWVIASRIEQIRQKIDGPIDRLAAGDPLRIAFGQLHGLSVAVLIGGMLAAVVALLLIGRHRVNAKSV